MERSLGGGSNMNERSGRQTARPYLSVTSWIFDKTHHQNTKLQVVPYEIFFHACASILLSAAHCRDQLYAHVQYQQ